MRLFSDHSSRRGSCGLQFLDITVVLGPMRAIFGTIWRNLVWAFAYNVLGLLSDMHLLSSRYPLHHSMMAGATMTFNCVGDVTGSHPLKECIPLCIQRHARRPRLGATAAAATMDAPCARLLLACRAG